MPSYVKAAQICGIVFALMMAYGVTCYFGEYPISDPKMLPMMWISSPFMPMLTDLGLVTEGYQWERAPSIFGWALISTLIFLILFVISAAILYIRDMDKDPLD